MPGYGTLEATKSGSMHMYAACTRDGMGHRQVHQTIEKCWAMLKAYLG